MAARRKKIDYEIDETSDLFIAPTWPESFLRDPAYSLFRPLYEYTSPWRTSYDALYQYLNGQARRMGGRQHILFHFSNLSLISSGYTQFHAFLSDPFTPKHNLTWVFSDLEKFLRWRFAEFSDSPWRDFPAREKIASKGRISEKDLEAIPCVLSDTDRKKLLKKELAKIPWQTQLQRSLEYESGIEGFHTALIENALKECPELLHQRHNEDLVQQVFSSPLDSMTLTMGEKGYLIAEIPVMLGSHYLGKKTQKVWFDARGKKFYRILGCYARWDNAQVVIFKASVHNDAELQKQMFAEIKEGLLLVGVGNWKKAIIDGSDYYLSLLIDSDLPERSFFVSEWEINCPNLMVKDTETHANA
jgi:hypothetical protein